MRCQHLPKLPAGLQEPVLALKFAAVYSTISIKWNHARTLPILEVVPLQIDKEHGPTYMHGTLVYTFTFAV